VNRHKPEFEKIFLLKSLDDLDEELANGDISQKDYLQLTQNYKRRLVRLSKREQNANKESKLQNGKKTWVTIIFLIALASISGLAIANSSGERSNSESLTGSLRESTISKLQQAQQLLGDSASWSAAISLYDEVLEEQPSNVEAITYRAWLNYRQGNEIQPLIEEWNEVRILNPNFADAIVFLTIALADELRFPEALTQLQELQKIDVGLQLESVIESQGLYGRVYAEAKYSILRESNQPSLDDLEMNISVALQSANYLLQSEKQQRSVSALKLFRAVLAANPSNPEALSREALLMAQTGDPELFERAINQVNIAVQENPQNIEALLTRATLLAGIDLQTACGDLVSILLLSDLENAGIADQILEQVNNLSLTLEC
jgi:Flp pilus assembly protein TadD|tara:strand:+ start:6821 stop:7948 length:1128 start_codon:yes stop_codon:yes gene_type:complete